MKYVFTFCRNRIVQTVSEQFILPVHSPTFTFAVSPNMVAPLLAATAIVVAASILYGYITILVIIVAYVVHIPFAIRTRRFLAAHPEVWDDKPRQQRAARRAIRRAQPHRRSNLRLGLRRPGS